MAYTFAITAGSLPSGLGLDSAGNISGTATVAGTFNFTVTATDQLNATGSQAYKLIIATPTITLSPATLSTPIYGSSYSQIITATGGTAPYTYAVTSGTLPAGLTLGTSGNIFGTPTSSGTSNFTITATDNYGFTGNRPYSVTITAPTIILNYQPSQSRLWGILFSKCHCNRCHCPLYFCSDFRHFPYWFNPRSQWRHLWHSHKWRNLQLCNHSNR